MYGCIIDIQYLYCIFVQYREICPVGVPDETLHTIIRKHKDKSDKQDLIAADIGALYGKCVGDEIS